MEKTLELLEFNKILDMLSSKADTPLGRELIEDLRPVSSLRLIEKWQKETSDGCNFLIKTNLDLSDVTDLRVILARCQKGGILNSCQLKEINQNLLAFRKIKKVFLQYGRGALLSMTRGINNFQDLEGHLKVIDDNGELLDKASPVLYQIRRETKNIRGRIQRELDRILKSPVFTKYLQEGIVTQRNDRYVVPVKAEYKAQVSGIIHDQSSSGATFFIEPMPVVEANNKLNHLLAQEKKEIDRILAELSSAVAQEADIIIDTLNIIAEIDFILAKSRLSMDMKGNEPLLNDKGYFRIVKGKHPLLKGKVVPISVELGKKCHTMVITGPNTGGKTVTLKTVGLIALMAQAGLHVPAGSGTETCVFDKVFADIGDEQNIEQSLSTFSGHMKNIIDIFRNLSDNSLVLLDEIGAGTDPTEGAALAMSILEHLHSTNARTIATTHFSSIKSFAYDHEEMENASVEFDPETLQPTFRVQQGIAGSSNAFEIAARLGLKGHIIEKAKMYMGEEQLKLKRLMENLEESQRKIDLHQKSMNEDKDKIEDMKRELEEESLRVEEKRKEALQKAREEALLIVNQAQRKAERMIKELEKSTRENETKKSYQLYQNLKNTLKNDKEDLIEEIEQLEPDTTISQQELKKGQTVFIKSLKQKGKILDFTESGEVNVQAGVMKISTGCTDLAKVSESSLEKPMERENVSGLSLQKSRHIKAELNLRGDTLQEAIEKADKYLDDCYLAGLNTVYIIHGKGTGALRKGLHDYLSDHSQVNSFKISEHYEGGAGVTIVTLKS